MCFVGATTMFALLKKKKKNTTLNSSQSLATDTLHLRVLFSFWVLLHSLRIPMFANVSCRSLNKQTIPTCTYEWIKANMFFSEVYEGKHWAEIHASFSKLAFEGSCCIFLNIHIAKWISSAQKAHLLTAADPTHIWCHNKIDCCCHKLLYFYWTLTIWYFVISFPLLGLQDYFGWKCPGCPF